MRSTNAFTRITMTTVMGMAAVAASLLLAGCGQKYEPAMKAAGEMHAAAADLATTQANIGGAIAALDSLAGASGDLRSKYNTFGKALDKLGKSAKDTEAKANAMREKGEAYFAKWDKEVAAISNEDIRARSDARKAEVKKQFQEVSDLYQSAKAQFTPFWSDLKDIHTALGTDLTPAGIASVKDVIGRAGERGRTLQETARKLADQFTALGAKVSPKGK
jgi:hypothetical protein